MRLVILSFVKDFTTFYYRIGSILTYTINKETNRLLRHLNLGFRGNCSCYFGSTSDLLGPVSPFFAVFQRHGPPFLCLLLFLSQNTIIVNNLKFPQVFKLTSMQMPSDSVSLHSEITFLPAF